MAYADLVKKSEKDLGAKADKLRLAIDQARRDLLDNKTEAVKVIRTSKKELAQVLTAMNSKRKER